MGQLAAALQTDPRRRVYKIVRINDEDGQVISVTHRGTGVFIDANLLVLLVAGRTDRRLIAKHKRLREFTTDDYDHLANLLIEFGTVFLTPNTLTEASNLLAQHGDPERSRCFGTLKALIETTEEIVIASVDVSRNSAFQRLGLTDAALLAVVSDARPLVTVDFDLYRAASRKAPNAALNFRHLTAM